MKEFDIPFAFEQYGRITVKAKNLEEAYEKAEEELANMSVYDMQMNSEYLADSEEIDYDGIVFDETGVVEK